MLANVKSALVTVISRTGSWSWVQLLYLWLKAKRVLFVMFSLILNRLCVCDSLFQLGCVAECTAKSVPVDDDVYRAARRANFSHHRPSYFLIPIPCLFISESGTFPVFLDPCLLTRTGSFHFSMSIGYSRSRLQCETECL